MSGSISRHNALRERFSSALMGVDSAALRPEDARRGDSTWYGWIAPRLFRFGLERPSRQVIEDFLGGPLSPAALLADMRRMKGAALVRVLVSGRTREVELQDSPFAADQPAGARAGKPNRPEVGDARQQGPAVAFVGRPGGAAGAGGDNGQPLSRHVAQAVDRAGEGSRRRQRPGLPAVGRAGHVVLLDIARRDVAAAQDAVVRIPEIDAHNARSSAYPG